MSEIGHMIHQCHAACCTGLTDTKTINDVYWFKDITIHDVAILAAVRIMRRLYRDKNKDVINVSVYMYYVIHVNSFDGLHNKQQWTATQ